MSCRFWVYSKAIVIHTHISILSQILFPCRLLQNIDYSSLCCMVGPCCLPILYTVLYTIYPNLSLIYPNLSLPILPILMLTCFYPEVTASFPFMFYWTEQVTCHHLTSQEQRSVLPPARK